MLAAWRFRTALRPYWLHVAVGLLVSLLSAAAWLAAPWPLFLLVDHVIGDRPVDLGLPALTEAVADLDARTLTAVALGSFAGIVALNSLCDYLATYLIRGAGEQLAGDLRARTLLGLDVGSTIDGDGARAGELRHAADDIRRVQESVVASLLVLPNVLVFLGIVVIVLAIDPAFALAALAVAPVLFLTVFRYARRLARASEELASREDALARRGYLWSSNIERLTAGLTLVGVQARVGPLSDVVTALGTGAVLWFGIDRVLAGDLTLGLLVVSVAYILQLYRPVGNLSRLASVIRDAKPALARATELLGGTYDAASPAEAAPASASRPAPVAHGAPGGKDGTFKAARTFWPFLRAHWRGFVPAIFGLVAFTLVGLLKPWPLKFLIDDVLGVGTAEGGADDPLVLVTAVAGAIVGIAVLQALFNFIKDFFLSATSQRIAFSVRGALFAQTQRLSLDFHDRQRTGDMITRVTSDVTKVQELVSDKLLVDGVASVLQFAGMIGIMFFFDWQLGLVALAWAPLVVLTSSYFRRRIKAEEQQVRESEGDMTSLTQETLSSIRVVKAFGRERETVEKFEEQTGDMLEASVRVARLEARYSSIVTVLTAGGLAAMVFFGAYRVLAGALTAGTLVVFIQYMRDLQSPLNTLSRLWAKLARVMVRAERIMEVLHEEPTVEERPGARPAPRFHGYIRFSGVSFGYAPDERVLRNVDLVIEPGELVAIVGPTGAGKSTIASLFLRLYDPAEGAVTIDGGDIRNYTLASVTEQISVVLQESLLFQTTILENIAYGYPRASVREIEQAARIAFADEFIRALPHGYDTVVGERGTTLSGGQRQRIAIARAVVRDAPILILDEPTTGLDVEAQSIVMKALERLMEGRTTLMIAHNLTTVRRADRIYFVEDGRIVEHGTHAELMSARGRYLSLYVAQEAGDPSATEAELA